MKSREEFGLNQNLRFKPVPMYLLKSSIQAQMGDDFDRVQKGKIQVSGISIEKNIEKRACTFLKGKPLSS